MTDEFQKSDSDYFKTKGVLCTRNINTQFAFICSKLNQVIHNVDTLKEKLVSSFLAFESGLNGHADFIRDIRSEAIKTFEDKGFPTKREEEWKYTSLKPVLKHDYKILSHPESNLEYKDVKRYFLHEIDSYKLVFIDGVFSSWLSETTHKGYDVCTFSAALNKYQDVLKAHFTRSAPGQEAMVALNTAFAKEGAFINIPDNKVVEKPIQILYFSSKESGEAMVQPRNLVVVGKNAQVQIVERHQSLSDHPVLTNAVTEVSADEHAVVDYYKIQNDLSTASLIDTTAVKQQKGSTCNFGTFSFGGKLTRNNLNFYLKDERCESHLNGISIIGERQLVDHHTLVDHQVPHCNSNELYKGIYSDYAKGVFNGKVMVHPQAQKTNAFQQNNNILLSDTASIDTKPQLEIFADDVSCSHGCTVGQLDEHALFYMRSRGIAEKEAKALLMYAFTNDVLSQVKISELKNKLNFLIAKKLGVDLHFEL